jgi:pimeloyl-ACP methyl ester carboxylesterase
MATTYNISKEIYPFEGKYVDLTDLKLHYLDEGSGDPIVMLHGNPSWSIYYRNLVKALRGEYRCIVPDHIGCGFSDKPDDSSYDYTLEQRVSDLEMLLQYLKIEKNITLVVHDWGGMIGMAYATRNPGAVKRIVLLNTAAFHLPKVKKFPLPLWFVRNTELGGAMVRHFNAFAVAASIFGCSRKMMSNELRDAYCAPYDSWDNRIATLRFVQDIPLKEGDIGYDTVTEVQNNLSMFDKTPVLICWGEKDFVFDIKFLNEWLTYLPQAEVHKFPDCGHYILEDASDEIIKLVQEFLKKNPIKQKV